MLVTEDREKLQANVFSAQVAAVRAIHASSGNAPACSLSDPLLLSSPIGTTFAGSMELATSFFSILIFPLWGLMQKLAGIRIWPFFCLNLNGVSIFIHMKA